MEYAKIKPYIEKGLVTEKSHPEHEHIRLFNYTPECQFSKAWDEVTTQCRGLIMNIETGEILARPFEKFFNLSEHTEVLGKDVPSEEPEVYEKYDGSLGILYWIDDTPHIATRGSFTSEQAQWATDWLHKNVVLETINPAWTYLFEIVYPENRIVVDYDFSGLVFLASRATKTGAYTNNPYPPKTYTEPMRRAERYPFTSLNALETTKEDNCEGFVLYYPKSALRLKIKLEEYVRLHKIITGLSVKGVWEWLREHGIDANVEDMAKDVPDEFYKWLNTVSTQIKNNYIEIDSVAVSQFMGVPIGSRKEKAEVIKKMDYPAVGFAMLDRRDYADIIWKIIRPKGSQTYKIDEI